MTPVLLVTVLFFRVMCFDVFNKIEYFCIAHAILPKLSDKVYYLFSYSYDRLLSTL